MGLRVSIGGEERLFEGLGGTGRSVAITITGSQDAVSITSAAENEQVISFDYSGEAGEGGVEHVEIEVDGDG